MTTVNNNIDTKCKTLFISGSGIISKSELKYFYTAFMDVGKLGEQRLDEITTNAYSAMTSVSVLLVNFYNAKLQCYDVSKWNPTFLGETRTS